jgi:DNA-binding MarR family transcriptional regulator
VAVINQEVSLLMNKSDMLLLDNQLCFALYSTSLAMTKVYRKALKKLGLTYSQYLVMLILWEKDQQSVSAIGERLFLDSATLTPLLKRMELANLLARQRAPNDERFVIVSLTAKGKQLKIDAGVVPDELLCATACELDDLMSLKEQLEHLRKQLIKNI